MKHLDFLPTPINYLPYFSRKLCCNIYTKRDDLFTEAGGGSKSRMLQYILANVDSSNTDVLVTAGGPCSNFNRACALMCAKLGVPMHLIEYTDEPEEWESLNYYLCQLVGIRTTRCDKSVVPNVIQSVIDDYKKQDLNVKNVYGGGKSIEGFYAYYDAVRELKEQCSSIDYLYVACGTGTTLTGICAGVQKWFPNTSIHAISTARTYDSERLTLEENMKLLNEFLGENFDFENLTFHDEYLCGGYAKYSGELMDTVKESLSREGMIIDPTYSGKAFYGMVKTIETAPEVFNNKKILFWNTGGLFNLLSTKK